ncbi:hypothetical protein ACOBQX_18465 [Actinokineospora sp. G85]|uniref:hypothetical protein n=1 Tax=Actinokineospora sp. G85 TaxID=3406626 RepID=UPI003C70BECE
MTTYLERCDSDAARAAELYVWNAHASAAFWQTLGHLEVALRNTMSSRMAARHQRLRRAGTSWLDDPAHELQQPAKDEILKARSRVSRAQRTVSHDHTVAELNFGFWRFLLVRHYQGLFWPDLASGFPHAPNRRPETIEKPVARLHKFRNRLAHHETSWNKDLGARFADIRKVLGYVDPELEKWVISHCGVSAVLATCPVERPRP